MKNNEKIKTAKEIAKQEQCVNNASQVETKLEEKATLGVAKEPHCDSYVLTSLMNVRKTPSFDAEVIRKAPKGSLVQVLRLENDWLCIKNGGFIYYKGGEYAKKI